MQKFVFESKASNRYHWISKNMKYVLRIDLKNERIRENFESSIVLYSDWIIKRNVGKFNEIEIAKKEF